MQKCHKRETYIYVILFWNLRIFQKALWQSIVCYYIGKWHGGDAECNCCLDILEKSQLFFLKQNLKGDLMSDQNYEEFDGKKLVRVAGGMLVVNLR